MNTSWPLGYHVVYLCQSHPSGLPMPESPKWMMSSCDAPQVLHSGRPPAASCLALPRKVKIDLYCISFHDYPPSFLILLCTLGSDQNGWRQQITFVLQLLVCIYQQSIQRWGRLGLWLLSPQPPRSSGVNCVLLLPLTCPVSSLHHFNTLSEFQYLSFYIFF